MTAEIASTSQPQRLSQAANRLHYIDWLRVIAILGVWAYHSARPFMLQEWLINNGEKSPTITFIFLVFLGSMGMPLFFMMAGAGCLFALRRRSGKQFLSERSTRLLIPFVIGCLLLSPLQFYLEWLHKGWYQGAFLPFLPVLAADRLHSLVTTFSPTIFLSLGSHLWFLGFLFTFSLIALPLFLWLKTGAGSKVTAALGRLGEVRGGLLVFIIPVAAVRMSLQPFFPEYTDWADFTYMLVFFICGFLLFSDERLIQSVRRDWRIFLAVGLASTLIMLVGLAFGGGAAWVKDPAVPGFYLGWGLAGVNGWCLSLFVLWLGMRLLDFRNRRLDQAQELMVPFYVFHQPAIVLVAFFVVAWQTALPLKLGVVLAASLLITLAVCQGVVCRIKPARALFGMKPNVSS
jgi:peptidoglycan/LPS O-acetylase OafA/YrhL